MLFIIRDPRDLVISRSDFVRSKAYLSRPWNAYLQRKRARELPSDEESISAQIESHLSRKLDEFLPWLHSPAGLTVRFEDLYSDLTQVGEAPTLKKILDYLEINVDLQSLRSVLDKSRTSSGREKKIGIWRERMTPKHLERICQPDFQKLVVQFGY